MRRSAPASRAVLLVSLFWLIASVGGCRPPRDTRPAVAVVPASVAAAPKLTEAQCLQFAQALELAVAEQDHQHLAVVFDWNARFDQALAGLGRSPRFRESMLAGFRRGIEKSGGVLYQLGISPEHGNRYELLRVRRERTGWEAVFRVQGADGSLNYHELRLGLDGRAVCVTDMYGYATGELLSASLRRLALSAAAHEDRSPLDRALGRELLLVKHIDTYQAVLQSLRDGDSEGVLRAYRRLPTELQSDKILLVARLTAAGQLGLQEEAEAAVETLAAEYPGDDCLNLMAIDYYTAREEYEKALSAIGRVNSAVGGDPMLEVAAANVHLAAGDNERAARSAAQIIERHPDWYDAYWVGVDAAVAQRDHNATLRWLRMIDQRFEVEWPDLSREPVYSDFVASPQHREWLAHMAQE